VERYRITASESGPHGTGNRGDTRVGAMEGVTTLIVHAYPLPVTVNRVGPMRLHAYEAGNPLRAIPSFGVE
jgi:hypothetical protein